MIFIPYDSKKELPKNVKDNLPEHAKKIYLKAYNNAWEQYKDPEDRFGNESREEVAHKVAWSAVKNVYKKEEGEWIKK